MQKNKIAKYDNLFSWSARKRFFRYFYKFCMCCSTSSWSLLSKREEKIHKCHDICDLQLSVGGTEPGQFFQSWHTIKHLLLSIVLHWDPWYWSIISVLQAKKPNNCVFDASNDIYQSSTDHNKEGKLTYILILPYVVKISSGCVGFCISCLEYRVSH